MPFFLWCPRMSAQPPGFQQSPLPVPLRRWPLPSRRAVSRCTSRVLLRKWRLGCRSSARFPLPGHHSTCQPVNESGRLPRASDGRCSFQRRCRCDKYQHVLFEKKASNRAPMDTDHFYVGVGYLRGFNVGQSFTLVLPRSVISGSSPLCSCGGHARQNLHIFRHSGGGQRRVARKSTGMLVGHAVQLVDGLQIWKPTTSSSTVASAT